MSAPAWLRERVATLAWCWRLERRDGMVLGLTSHDRDLVLDGVPYRAAPGMKPSAIEARSEIAADTLDIEGALTSAAISEMDLDNGRWDGAALTLFVTDWSAPEGRTLVLAAGELGQIERRGRAFAAELQSAVRVLDAPLVPVTSPTCRADLGDRACRVDLAGLERRGGVTAVSGRQVTLDFVPGAGTLAFGALRWMSGRAAGLESIVAVQAGAVLTLATRVPAGVAVGDRVRVTAGCDRQLATCQTRFANVANFRGEAFLPGNDLLTRYPGG